MFDVQAPVDGRKTNRIKQIFQVFISSSYEVNESMLWVEIEPVLLRSDRESIVLQDAG